MDFGLSDEQRMIVGMVRRFVQDRAHPARGRDRSDGCARPGEGADDLREVEGARLLRDEHPRGIRRRRPVRGRHDAGRGAVRPHEGHPDPARVRQRLRIAARRHACAEGALAAARRARRAHVLDRDHRARRGIGRRRDHDPRRPRRRRLAALRQQALHQRRRILRFLHRVRGDRRRGDGRATCRCFSSTRTCRADRRPQPADDGPHGNEPRRALLRGREARPRASAGRRRPRSRHRLRDAWPRAARAGRRARDRQGEPPRDADDRITPTSASSSAARSASSR